MQAALHRVAKHRTTIVIAHRLSTIKNADQIVVVAKGEVIQQGVHKSLLKDKDGAYWKLVNAQQLATMGTTSTTGTTGISTVRLIVDDVKRKGISRGSSILIEKEGYETLIESKITASDELEEETLPTSPSFLRSFATLLAEQKSNWIGYLIMMVAAMGAAGERNEITMPFRATELISTTSKQPFTGIPFCATHLLLWVFS